MHLNRMSACMLPLFVLPFLTVLIPNGQASVIVGCPIFRYMSNGMCYTCPDNCRECVSDTNCSLCQRGFYGPVCENRCGEGCTGTCHKVFGHCTYGCPDREYPAEGNGCRLCPQTCSLCESQSKCVLCEAGYFGEDCQERCPEHCATCYKTTGQCLQCKDSKFMLNGQCRSCPQGCRSCDSINTCTQCTDSYFKHDRLCKGCPYGCRFCNTTDSCQSCENGFYGPVDGRCLYKCPDNGVMTYNIPYEDGRCGIWQDTVTNICHLQSESHNCASSGNCILVIRCPYSVRCRDTQNEHPSCATIMQYECKHRCERILSVYGCETTCNVHPRGNTGNNRLCLADDGFISLRTFKNTAKADCIQEHVASSDTTDNSLTTVWVLGVVTTLLAIIIVIILVLLHRLAKQKQSKEEGSNWKERDVTPYGAQAKRLSTTSTDDVHITESLLEADSSINERFGNTKGQGSSETKVNFDII